MRKCTSNLLVLIFNAFYTLDTVSYGLWQTFQSVSFKRLSKQQSCVSSLLFSYIRASSSLVSCAPLHLASLKRNNHAFKTDTETQTLKKNRLEAKNENNVLYCYFLTDG